MSAQTKCCLLGLNVVCSGRISPKQRRYETRHVLFVMEIIIVCCQFRLIYDEQTTTATQWSMPNFLCVTLVTSTAPIPRCDVNQVWQLVLPYRGAEGEFNGLVCYFRSFLFLFIIWLFSKNKFDTLSAPRPGRPTILQYWFTWTYFVRV